jgi:hypothetical protein
MDPRIADFIRENRKRYTREAIRQQLVDAGHDPADVDAVWEMLHAPDPDEAGVAGEGFWGRFWLYLIGLNVAVFLLVVLSTGALAFGGVVLAIVLAIALGIGALISWGIVAATGPAKMGRTTAMVVGGVIPLVFAFLIGGTCYGLLAGLGPPPPPPQSGVMELHIDPPLAFDGSGAAFCQIQPNSQGFSIFAQEGSLGTIDGTPVHASVDSFSDQVLPEGEGAAPPDLAPGEESRGTVNVYIAVFPRNQSDPPREWFVSPNTQLDVDAAPDGLSGTVTFEGLQSAVFDAPAPGATDSGRGDAISGTITWACEERGS